MRKKKIKTLQYLKNKVDTEAQKSGKNTQDCCFKKTIKANYPATAFNGNGRAEVVASLLTVFLF